MAGAFEQIEAVLAEARAAHAELLSSVTPALRASLPVDATGVTRAIDILAAAVGLSGEIRAARDRLNRANPAVLHGRVYGRAPLAPDTVVAAFAEGARARATLLERLAEAIGGDDLRDDLRSLLADHPPPDGGAPDRIAVLRAAYAAQERAVLLCAGRLDAAG
jgi:hypothetical protein